MKVLVSDNLGEVGIQMFEDEDGMSVDVKTGLSPEELEGIIDEYDALVIRSATKVTESLLDAARQLKVDRTGRNRPGQCGHPGGHQTGHGGDEHAWGQCGDHRRTHHRHDAVPDPQYPRGDPYHEERPVGEKTTPGAGDLQQDAGRHRFWQNRFHCGRPCPRV